MAKYLRLDKQTGEIEKITPTELCNYLKNHYVNLAMVIKELDEGMKVSTPFASYVKEG